LNPVPAPPPCARDGRDSRKELVMSITRKVLAVVATLTVAAGLSTVGTLSATAATPQCGPNCIQIFSAKFGTNANPNFVETVFQGVARVGQPTILARPSSSNPAGDLIATAPGMGLVSDFFAAGLVSAAVNQHYGNLNAAQIEYAPFGKRTGLCAGLATTAFQNEGLTCSRAALRARPCGSLILPIRPRPRPPASRLSAARPRTSPTRSR
jgi:hypothetical protein